MTGRFQRIPPDMPLPGDMLPSRYLLKDSTVNNGFPPVARDLYFGQLKNDHLSVLDFFATSACVLMMESGFVAVNDDGGLSAQELMSLDYADRMARVAAELKAVLDQQGHLRSVDFKAIVPASNTSSEEIQLDDTVPPSPSVNEAVEDDADVAPVVAAEVNQDLAPPVVHEEFVYHDDIITVATAAETDREARILVECDQYSSSVTLHYREFCPGAITPHGMVYKYTPRGFFAQAKFKPALFSDRVKNRLIYHVVDVFDSICPETRGFQNLPPEIVMKIGQYCDVRTYVNLSMTCTRHDAILNSKDGWKGMCTRAKADFRKFGFRSDMADGLASNNTEGRDFREEYKDAYIAAKEEYRQRHPLPLRLEFVPGRRED